MEVVEEVVEEGAGKVFEEAVEGGTAMEKLRAALALATLPATFGGVGFVPPCQQLAWWHKIVGRVTYWFRILRRRHVARFPLFVIIRDGFDRGDALFGMNIVVH